MSAETRMGEVALFRRERVAGSVHDTQQDATEAGPVEQREGMELQRYEGRGSGSSEPRTARDSGRANLRNVE